MTDAKTLAERLRWLSHNSGWGDDATAKAAAELIERQNAELAALRAERDALRERSEVWRVAYEGACKLVADMHTAAMGATVGPALGVVEDVEALRAERDALLTVLKSVGLFLHHCWCDVQMNEYSFDLLNQQLQIVDAAIDAAKEQR